MAEGENPIYKQIELPIPKRVLKPVKVVEEEVSYDFAPHHIYKTDKVQKSKEKKRKQKTSA